MRAAGLQPLSDHRCFLQAARVVEGFAEAQGLAEEERVERRQEAVDAGLALVQFLVKSWSKLKWSSNQMHQLSKIVFVPAMDIRTAVGCHSYLKAPCMSSWRRIQSEAEQQGSNKLGNSRCYSKAASASGTAQLLQNEVQYVEDVEDELEPGELGSDSNFDAHLVAASAQLISSHQQKRGDKVAAVMNTFISFEHCGIGNTTKWVFKEGTKCGAILNLDAWQGFRVALVLPAIIDHAPLSLIKALCIQHPLPALCIQNHLLRLVDQGAEELAVGGEMRGIALACCVTLNAHQRCTSEWKRESTMGSIKAALQNLPFITTDGGSLVAPSHICTDLEVGDSLGSRALAVPAYLAPLSGLLGMIGAKASWQHLAPRVRVHSKNPVLGDSGGADDPPLLWSLIQLACGDKSLADIRFELAGGEEIWGHRLVLGLVSPVFKSFFTENTADAGFKSGSQGSAGCLASSSFAMPGWVQAGPFRCMLGYCYSGTVQLEIEPGGSSGEQVTVATEENVSLVCELLRLADHYLLDHLKESCEKLLADWAVISVYNCCDLVTHASNCNAQQLLNLCAHHILQLFVVVSETEQWAAMPDELQAEVMALWR